eukprot:9297-Heterococcus_DN1.PRE.1
MFDERSAVGLILNAMISTGHGVYRLMNFTVEIYDVRRQFGGITEPGAKSVLPSHAHKCNTSLDTMLANYNNCSEVDLERVDEVEVGAACIVDLDRVASCKRPREESLRSVNTAAIYCSASGDSAA